MKPTASWENLLAQLRIEFGTAIFYRCGPEWRPVPRVMPDEQLHLIQAGELEYIIGGKLYRARSRQIAFCPPGIEWNVKRVSREYVQLTVIHFQARFPGGRRYLDAFGFQPILIPRAPVWSKLARIGRELCALYKPKPSGHALKELALLHEFFHAFFPMRGQTAAVDRDGERVFKLIAFMRQHYRERITLKVLSQLVFLSPNHLATVFRDYTGRSPIDYLIQLRLEEARQLLQLPERTIAEITEHVGYDDPAYFSRLFRTHIGMSPAEFRRHQQSLI